MERKYQMTRLGKGDYLCPSNDLSEMWRFHAYEDGRHHGLMDVDYELRTFWRAVYMSMNRFKQWWESMGGELPDPWAYPGPWVEDSLHLPSRKACVERMLKHEVATLSR